MVVPVVPEWEGLVVLALMEDQYQGVQGMETSSEDNMVHLVNNKGRGSMEMVPREAGEDTISSKDTLSNSPVTPVRVVQTTSRLRTMLLHGQHTTPSIMLSMEVTEDSMVSSRDSNKLSNLLNSLKLLSNSNLHHNRIMQSLVLTLLLVKQTTVQLGPSTTDNKECIIRPT